MIGDKIQSEQINSLAASELLKAFEELTIKEKLVLAIAGESGSGKTYMSAALQAAFETNGRKAKILHMDDFFLLPPAQNHQHRLLDMQHVGPQEVDLKRLQQLLIAFKSGISITKVPLVHYFEDRIEEVEMELADTQVLIIEGTYSFYLEQTDFHLFMSRDYKQTRALREKRNRGNEVNDPFVELVLEKEHLLISSKKSKANAWIDFDFNLRYDV
jgi:uridine kinase